MDKKASDLPTYEVAFGSSNVVPPTAEQVLREFALRWGAGGANWNLSTLLEAFRQAGVR